MQGTGLMFPQENGLLNSLNVSSVKIPRFSLSGWNVSDCRNQNTLLKSFRERSGSLLPDVCMNARMHVGIYILLPYSVAAQVLDCPWYWIREVHGCCLLLENTEQFGICSLKAGKHLPKHPNPLLNKFMLLWQVQSPS